jgi:hypothetical protein
LLIYTQLFFLVVVLTSLVIARDICLMSGGFYVRYISLSPRPVSFHMNTLHSTNGENCCFCRILQTGLSSWNLIS